MKDRIFYSLLEFEQLEEDIWNDILQFAVKWNEKHELKFKLDVPAEAVIQFPSLEHAEFSELTEILKEKEGIWEWLFIHQKGGDPYLKENIEQCDFIEIIGDGYPDEFYLNELEVKTSFTSCPTCHTNDMLLSGDHFPLKIDNHHKMFADSKTRLDLINGSYDGLFVSSKFIDTIKGNKGFSLLPVKNKDGTISDLLFQLKVEHIIHKSESLAEPDSICDTCGAVIKQNAAPFTISKKEIGDFDFFSRSLYGLTKIHVRKELYEALQSKSFKEIVPTKGVMIKD